jgi:orotidine-5'-phosphate decarboxylase
MKPKPEDRLIVALDFPGLAGAESLMDRLSKRVSYFKIGLQLFTASGPRAIEAVKRRGARVFLDLKYHDIPNTVAGAVGAAASLGVDMLNLHASGGPAMMLSAAEAAGRASFKPKLLAVTALTSLDTESLEKTFGISGLSVEALVVRLASLSRDSGLDGVVASPREIASLRKSFGKEFVILTPGIRPSGSPPDDQNRTATPSEAVSRGADYIVVGRPITQAPDPLEAAGKILTEMADALG